MTMEAAVEVRDKAKKGLHNSIATVDCVRQWRHSTTRDNDNRKLTAMIKAVTASVLGFIIRGSSAMAFSSLARNILVRTEYR